MKIETISGQITIGFATPENTYLCNGKPLTVVGAKLAGGIVTLIGHDGQEYPVRQLSGYNQRVNRAVEMLESKRSAQLTQADVRNSTVHSAEPHTGMRVSTKQAHQRAFAAQA